MTGNEYAERAQGMRDKLYRMAYCYVKNEQDALDIVSEAVYKGYLKRDTLRESSYFSTWMTRIVINTALDHCRASGKNTSLEDTASAIAAPESGAAIEDRVDLYAALDTLPPEEKTLIMLKYFEDLRFSDIAELLKLSENTVKTRLYRALGRLRQHFEPQEGST